MSHKNCDSHNRFRSKTVGFRLSPEESKHLDDLVSISGMNKQDYIISKLFDYEIVVVGNSRVYKGLKDKLEDVFIELKRINNRAQVSDELINLIKQISVILYEMRDSD